MTGVPIDATQRRRALATVGIMAFGRKDYDRAEEVQTRLVDEARADGEPAEIATALYNLANTYLAQKRAEEAVETLGRALEGCLHYQLDDMLALVYCNLGVALHRAGEPAQAFEAFKVAHALFQAQGNLPAEAHVCDCLAMMHYEDGRQAEAEHAWHYALSVYDRIENPSMQDVRQGGRAAIEQKLEHFGCRHAA